MDVKFRNVAIGISAILLAVAALLFVLRAEAARWTTNPWTAKDSFVSHPSQGGSQLSPEATEKIRREIEAISDEEIRDALSEGLSESNRRLDQAVKELDPEALKRQFLDALESGDREVYRTLEVTRK